MHFKPNAQQAKALELIHDRVKAREPVTRVFGYAGTGKTSLAKYISDKNTVFAAFTGKAASVLSRKGCGAQTVHSLIYLPTGGSEAQIEALNNQLLAMGDRDFAKEREAIEKVIADIKKSKSTPGFRINPMSRLKDASLLVLDEVSMVNETMAHDLLGFDIPIIALGDPAQLPPVGGEGYFTAGGEGSADVMLTTIERQTGGSDIIRIATDIRNGLGLSGPEVVQQVKRSQVRKYDQILVGTNKTRRAKNSGMREILGMEGILSRGERIICLSNNSNIGVLNGQMFWVGDWKPIDDEKLYAQLFCDCNEDRETSRCELCGWYPKWIPVWVHGFSGKLGEESLKHSSYHKIAKAMCATYGYAITVHKAQGSEWNNVLVYDESKVFRKDSWRWLYTAVTRASENVTIVSGS